MPADETELVVKPELLPTEQKYTISDTHFVQPPELPLTVEVSLLVFIDILR